MARITVPASQFPALAVLAEHSASLPVLRGAAESIDQERRTVDAIARAFAGRTKIPLGDAKHIITQLRSLDGVRTTLGLSPKELFDALIEDLTEKAAASPEAKKIDLDKLRAAEKEIEAIFSADHPLGLVNKLNRLRYDYANVLINANILTDVRPIFDDAARDIKSLSVGYVLQIEYWDSTDRRQIFAALDAKDIAKLKSLCERAQTKTLTLQEKMKNLPWPLLVAGELTDDD